jgi:hypothetical protein
MNGGEGTLLAVLEVQDPAWVNSRAITDFSQFSLPRLRCLAKAWRIGTSRRISGHCADDAAAHPGASNGVLANDIAADLQAALNELKKQDVITPNEDKEFQEEIERIRKDATEKLDSSSWEASDAMREKFAAKVAEKAGCNEVGR